eukprot:TRINITY_DN7566_c0_g1_i1.p1 TRINITY_DN7566_c0_g1~~TRINITY_DN7566_c0_g1_i1.p1  ORF type:complete len:572 (-),score=132.10 TRINITY_DN7566_c0_g1_i1:239-1954(-)
MSLEAFSRSVSVALSLDASDRPHEALAAYSHALLQFCGTLEQFQDADRLRAQVSTEKLSKLFNLAKESLNRSEVILNQRLAERVEPAPTTTTIESNPVHMTALDEDEHLDILNDDSDLDELADYQTDFTDSTLGLLSSSIARSSEVDGFVVLTAEAQSLDLAASTAAVVPNAAAATAVVAIQQQQQEQWIVMQAQLQNQALLARLETSPAAGKHERTLQVMRKCAENIAVARQQLRLQEQQRLKAELEAELSARRQQALQQEKLLGGDVDNPDARVDHLVLVVHGIGEFQTTNVDRLRANCKSLAEQMFHNGDACRVVWRCCQWHKSLHELEGVDDVMEMIELPDLKKIRGLVKNTLLDILYFMSPKFRRVIVLDVVNQLNEIYRHFLQTHKNFSGRVHIFGHSLGSIITLDVLSGYNYQADPLPKFQFEVENFFAVGSPIGLFLTVRGDIASGPIPMPRCLRFFNIFHPFDPVAHRVEPLMNRDYAQQTPVQLPQYKQQPTKRNASLMRTDGISVEKFGSAMLSDTCRVDYCMQAKRTELISEYLAATTSHYCYWKSEDVMAFVLNQLFL